MQKKRLIKVLVPGTFDPITNGHLDVIRRAASLADEVVVGVAASFEKRGGPTFELADRIYFAQEATKDIENVEVESFNELLIDYANRIGAKAIVKGLRAMTDFEYEFQMTAVNFTLDRQIETIFIMSNPEYSYLSSSITKELAKYGAQVSVLVPPVVEKALHELYGKPDEAKSNRTEALARALAMQPRFKKDIMK